MAIEDIARQLGNGLGETLAVHPSDAPHVRYATVAAVNSDGTLDVTIDGTTLRGVCATTGCVGAAEGMRCVVLRQGPLATVVGLIASTDLGDVTLQDGNIYLPSGGYILGTDPNGQLVWAFSPCNAYGNVIIGHGSQYGDTNIYSGNNINLNPSNSIIANGRLIEKAALPVLWSGASWPTNTQTCNLSETVSSQSHGILLVWSAYDPSGQHANDTDWTIVAVPKSQNNGQGVGVPLMSGAYNGWKYVYVHDNKITGYASNSSASTTVGNMQRTNNRWVLRRVLGF